MNDPVEALKEVQLTIDSVLAENARMRTALRELDCGGGDYLTTRMAVAKLSGIPAMATSFDGHIAAIQKKLNQIEGGAS